MDSINEHQDHGDSRLSQTLCAAAAAAALTLTGLKLQLGLLSEEALGQGEAVPGGSTLQHGTPVDGGEDRHQHSQQRPWGHTITEGSQGQRVYEGGGVPGSMLHLPVVSSPMCDVTPYERSYSRRLHTCYALVVL